MAVARREVADPELGLRAIGFVDEDRAATRFARSGLRRIGDARAFRQALDEPIDDARGGRFVDIAGEPDHEVVGDDFAPPQLARRFATELADPRERGFGAE